MALNDATTARGRGWALWKALIKMNSPDVSPTVGAQAASLVQELLIEHQQAYLLAA